MFIICPKCSVKYEIPEGIILEKGQKLKCSACGFEFPKSEKESISSSIKTEDVLTEAFTMPLYTADDIKEKSSENKNVLEAFQPVVASERSPKSLWILPIYVILIVFLCIAGWSFRDMLNPSFKGIFSVSPELGQITSLKGGEKKEVPVQEPQKIAFKPDLEIKSVEPNMAPPQRELGVSSVVQKKKAVSDKPLVETEKEISGRGGSFPHYALGEVQKESEPSRNTLSEQNIKEEVPLFVDERPLFDEVASPILPAQPNELVIKDIVFRVEANEEGFEQLLIEGALQNLTNVARSVPILDVQVFDKAGQVLANKRVHITAIKLDPNEILPFYTGIYPAPLGIDHVEVYFK